MKNRATVLFITLMGIFLLLLLVVSSAGADGLRPIFDSFSTLDWSQIQSDRETSEPCLGNPDNCSPLITATPTIPMCPVEWCPWPPVGEKCHCPIAYTLIAPGGNYGH